MGNMFNSMKRIDEKLSKYSARCIDAAEEHIHNRIGYQMYNNYKIDKKLDSSLYARKKEQLRLLTENTCEYLESENKDRFVSHLKNLKKEKTTNHKNPEENFNNYLKDEIFKQYDHENENLLRTKYEDMYIDILKDRPKTYIKYVRNAPEGAIEFLGGKSRKHRKYKKRTHKNLH
jgi:hypothetical protein